MIGAGIVCGIGVASHELGIGGHLARRLSALTGRGADVALMGAPGLTVPAAERLLADVELAGFDAIVVVLGTREAIRLRCARVWARDIHEFLHQVTASAPPTLSIFMVGIAPLPSFIPFNRVLSPIVGRQVERLNAATWDACSTVGARFVPLGPSEVKDFGGLAYGSTYSAWADSIATHMHSALDEAAPVRHTLSADEEARQASLEAMDILDGPPTAELDALARIAKDLFGVMGAAVNLIDHERQYMKAAHGLERTDIPRSESFCSATVDLGALLVIEDTRLDPRFRLAPAVQQGVLFYAGYPVEAPNGQRVGTLCLFDTAPRRFTKADESLLRELALRVQAELWSNPGSLVG